MLTEGVSVIIIVFFLCLALGTWGASLVVRVIASRAQWFRLRIGRLLRLAPIETNEADTTKIMRTNLDTNAGASAKAGAYSKEHSHQEQARSVAFAMLRRLPVKTSNLSKIQVIFGLTVGPIFALIGTAGMLFTVTVGIFELEPSQVSWRLLPSAAFVLIGFAAIIVGARWDKSKGRRRCRACWYDYVGLADDSACPECGNVPANVKDLFRTRRSKALMHSSIAIFFIAFLAYAIPKVYNGRWQSLIPSTVLIATYEHLPISVLLGTGRFGARDDGSLWWRIQNDKLTHWQQVWLQTRARHNMATTNDIDVCMKSIYFCALDAPTSSKELDAAIANVFILFTDAIVANDPRAGSFMPLLLWSVSNIQNPVLTQAAIVSRMDVINAQLAKSTLELDLWIYGRLIVRFGVPTKESIDALFALIELPDPADTMAATANLASRTNDSAATLLGIFAGRDPVIMQRVNERFATSNGAVKLRYKIAQITPQLMPLDQNGITVNAFTPASQLSNTNLVVLRTLFNDADDLTAKAALRLIRYLKRYVTTGDTISLAKPELIELAIKRPGVAREAISTLYCSGQIDLTCAPAILTLLQSNTAANHAVGLDALEQLQVYSMDCTEFARAIEKIARDYDKKLAEATAKDPAAVPKDTITSTQRNYITTKLLQMQ